MNNEPGSREFYEKNFKQIDSLFDRFKALKFDAYWLKKGAIDSIEFVKRSKNFPENKMKSYFIDARKSLAKASELYLSAASYLEQYAKLHPSTNPEIRSDFVEENLRMINLSNECLSLSKKKNEAFLSE